MILVHDVRPDVALQTNPCGIEAGGTAQGRIVDTRYRRTLVGLKLGVHENGLVVTKVTDEPLWD